MDETRLIIFVPIEPIEERYSQQWLGWFQEAFDLLKKRYITVGDTKAQKIETGQFLDVYKTHSYKFKQLQEIVELLQTIQEPVTVFFMDLWFPGLEAIAYIRDTTKKDIQIKGILHAGTYDPWDFLAQCGLGRWGSALEKSWLTLADEVFVATEFHKALLVDARGHEFTQKIRTVQFPCYSNDQLRNTPKEDIVVFPHRLSPEKQPDKFKDLERRLVGRFGGLAPRFIRTQDQKLSKAEYYQLLARSKVAVSMALQETFGISMIEAVNLGCIPVAPDSLSYRETLEGYQRYSTDAEMVEMVYQGIVGYSIPKKSKFCADVRNIVEAI